MVGAILKLSYNIGNSSVEGGTCGNFFIIENNIAVTAHHILNSKNFKPNNGYSYCQYWFLINNIAIEINPSLIKEFPDKDLSFFLLETTQLNLSSKIADEKILQGEKCYALSYPGGIMPKVDANWCGDKLFICNVDLNDSKIKTDGKAIQIINNMTVDSLDVNVKVINAFEVGFISEMGMSGSPVFSEKTNMIIGILSFGLPENAKIKTRTFCIDAVEIKNSLKLF